MCSKFQNSQREMEMVEIRLRMMKKSQKMTLEKYLDFIDSNKQFVLTIANLNEIISIHGFKKAKGQKKVLADAVNTIELMDLRRSTLQEEISSEGYISLDEAIKDLTNLNWQECCVTSLQTICFSNGVRDSDHCQTKTNASASSMPNMPPPTKKPKSTQNRMLREMSMRNCAQKGALFALSFTKEDHPIAVPKL